MDKITPLYQDHRLYSDEYRHLFVAIHGSEPRALPTGKFTSDGTRMWARNPHSIKKGRGK